MRTEIRLEGHLICATAQEAAHVQAALPRHIALTRAEPGCLAFEVVQTKDPLVWRVCERFRDAPAFEAHQARAARSDWAVQTAGITRDYTVTGLA